MSPIIVSLPIADRQASFRFYREGLEPAQQASGYAGTFADPDGHLWMVTGRALIQG